MVAKPEFENDLDHLIECMDQPSIDGVNTYYVAKVAAETGLKVAISGLGADELFGGYPSFSQLPRAVRAFKSIPIPIGIGRIVRHLTAPVLKRITSPKYASIFEYGASFAGAFLLRRGLFMPWEISDLIDPETVMKGLEELETLTQIDDRLSPVRTSYGRVMALEIIGFLQPRLLRDTDWAGMAHSLEIRTPYVDSFLFRKLTPLMTRDSVPPSKQDLAACSPTPLPRSLTERAKTGFNVPVREWHLQGADGPRSRTRGLRSWALLVAERLGFQRRRTKVRA